VSGKWIDPPVVFVHHDVDREFHYWRDVVDRIAPPWAKSPRGMPQLSEVPWVLERGWVHSEDRMDGATLDFINREKMHAIRLAQGRSDRWSGGAARCGQRSTTICGTTSRGRS
jgi:hypothetical protein